MVTLISGPNTLPIPVGANILKVISAEEMASQVMAESSDADVLIMAAAVADYRSSQPEKEKIKKSSGMTEIKLKPTEDILLSASKQKSKTGFPKVLVGFAAESQNLIKNAEKKLKEKGLDLIIANDISTKDAGFAVDTNQVTLLFTDGRSEELALMSKEQVSEEVMKKILEFLN